eukprot:TRINITY_DN63854_c0_g1_i1.p1 TRINITY_DN63854_c0_g1~~TRINITY_DN63854_c0_g1_i1.p1  ORF type:complete len:248 (-),score=35.97 TRINITY_DN63854_c0_g1_i1:92-835(-)
MVALPREIAVLIGLVSVQFLYQSWYQNYVGSDGKPVQLDWLEDTLRSFMPDSLTASTSASRVDRNGQSPNARDPKSAKAGKASSARRPKDGRFNPEKGFLGEFEAPGEYAFRVGDIVLHRKHGQIGVVVERFENCQMSDEWFTVNAAPGMTRDQPFYTILIDSGMRTQMSTFTRHGAQSSHRRFDPDKDGTPEPIRHRDVKSFLKNYVFDPKEARYRPNEALRSASEKRDDDPAGQVIHKNEWDKEQ